MLKRVDARRTDRNRQAINLGFSTQSSLLPLPASACFSFVLSATAGVSGIVAAFFLGLAAFLATTISEANNQELDRFFYAFY